MQNGPTETNAALEFAVNTLEVRVQTAPHVSFNEQKKLLNS